MLRPKSSIHAALLVCAVASDAAAETALSSVQFYEYCKAFQTAPRSTEGRACAAYVRGFLDGAVASDTRVQFSAVKAESWLERARRTRLGTRHVRKPAYCIESSTPLEQIIGNVLAYAEIHQLRDDLPASEVISSALQRFYAC